MIANETITWLLESQEPWTRYRTRLDLLNEDHESPAVIDDRKEMIDHPLVKGLISKVKKWPEYALKRHNDANHPLHALAVLADFGINFNDLGMDKVIAKIKRNQSPEGAFETQIRLYKQFGGLEGEYWTWMACDAPVLLYALASFGLGLDPAIQKAKEHLLGQVNENGWRCSASPKLGNFKGPGKREDPCPIANVYTLRALSVFPELLNDQRLNVGLDMLLDHWQIREEKKYFLFGIGTDFQKLKYPFIWYDILHILEVLSRFRQVRNDPRYNQMLEIMLDLGEENNLFIASSMYRAWKDWSFANKKESSPWLTFLVNRILARSVEK